MTRLSYDRCCAEIVAQTDLLRSAIKGDMTTPVPSCPGRTLHLHATDTAPEAAAPEAAAEWLVDLTGDTIVWRRAHEKAAVTVRGPLIDLLLVVYRRRPARSEGIEILGDGQLLDFWLERISFG
ncbi:MAG: hypothetical protein ACT4NY_15190 [Pseudonocardiales bacterium]